MTELLISATAHIHSYGYERTPQIHENEAENLGIVALLNTYPEALESQLNIGSNEVQVLHELFGAKSNYGCLHNLKSGSLNVEGGIDLFLKEKFTFDYHCRGVLSRKINLDDKKVFPRWMKFMDGYALKYKSQNMMKIINARDGVKQRKSVRDETTGKRLSKKNIPLAILHKKNLLAQRLVLERKLAEEKGEVCCLV